MSRSIKKIKDKFESELNINKKGFNWDTIFEPSYESLQLADKLMHISKNNDEKTKFAIKKRERNMRRVLYGVRSSVKILSQPKTQIK